MFPGWFIRFVGLMLSLTGLVYGQSSPPSCSSRTEVPRQSVSGTVSDATGARLTSATVHLTCGTRTYQARTDSSGHFTLSALEGDYRLQVDAAGFAPYTKTLAITSDIQNVDITLSVQNAITVFEAFGRKLVTLPATAR